MDVAPPNQAISCSGVAFGGCGKPRGCGQDQNVDSFTRFLLRCGEGPEVTGGLLFTTHRKSGTVLPFFEIDGKSAALGYPADADTFKACFGSRSSAIHIASPMYTTPGFNLDTRALQVGRALRSASAPSAVIINPRSSRRPLCRTPQTNLSVYSRESRELRQLLTCVPSALTLPQYLICT